MCRKSGRLERGYDGREPVEFEDARVGDDERSFDPEFKARVCEFADSPQADSIGGGIIEIADEVSLSHGELPRRIR